jgi:hypothetical protein
MINIVPYSAYYTLGAIRERCIDSFDDATNTPVQISLAGRSQECKMLYTRDARNNISDGSKDLVTTRIVIKL